MSISTYLYTNPADPENYQKEQRIIRKKLSDSIKVKIYET